MAIPYKIKRAAASTIKAYPGARVIFLGDYKGNKAYLLQMPGDTVTGYPQVMLLHEGKVVWVIGEESFGILSQFRSED